MVTYRVIDRGLLEIIGPKGVRECKQIWVVKSKWGPICSSRRHSIDWLGLTIDA